MRISNFGKVISCQPTQILSWHEIIKMIDVNVIQWIFFHHPFDPMSNILPIPINWICKQFIWFNIIVLFSHSYYPLVILLSFWEWNKNVNFVVVNDQLMTQFNPQHQWYRLTHGYCTDYYIALHYIVSQHCISQFERFFLDQI